MPNPTLFDAWRISMHESIELTQASLTAYGQKYRHWAIAWSGGKDSTSLLTVVLWLIRAGRVPAPETLTVCYADTRMELPPLAIAAAEIMEQLRAQGIEVRHVMAPLDKRYFVYMLGRGVPPPNNNTLRWCTEQIKVKPMEAALRELYGERKEKILMLTGVRQGESAIRDGRIAMSCGRNGAECGQGWYQETLPDELCDKLAPLLHWRVCHVWAWLRDWAPKEEYGGWFSVSAVADAYGGDEAEEINARTGCLGCPLANHDTALDIALKSPRWAYLESLKGLRPLYREIRLPQYRKRMPPGEARKDGVLFTNQNRLGPLTMDTRAMALDRVLTIQAEVNAAAVAHHRPVIDILNAEEEARIRELWSLNTWPNRWSGDEPIGDEPYEEANQTASALAFAFAESH